MASRVTGSGPNRREILEAAGAIGAVLAWPVSGIPIYYWRYQLTGGITRSPKRA